MKKLLVLISVMFLSQATAFASSSQRHNFKDYINVDNISQLNKDPKDANHNSTVKLIDQQHALVTLYCSGYKPCYAHVRLSIIDKPSDYCILHLYSAAEHQVFVEKEHGIHCGIDSEQGKNADGFAVYQDYVKET